MIVEDDVLDSNKYFHTMEKILQIDKDIFNYFESAGCHGGLIDINRIMFFGDSGIIHMPKYVTKTIYLSLDADEMLLTNSSIFDMINSADLSCNSINPITTSDLENAVLLKYNHSNSTQYVIGYYFPKINCLSLCDLSHNSKGVRLFNNFFWKQIKDVLGLKPILDKHHKKSNKIEILAETVGSDPEFEIYNNYNDVMSADDVVAGDTSDPIGVDGNSSVCEFRPKPGKNGMELADNLMSLINEFDDRYGPYKLKVSGNRLAIGSHIHLGLNKSLLNKFSRNQVLSLCTAATDRIENIYKKMLDIVYNTNGSARGEYSYNRPFELKHYGFEYRLSPASVHLIPNVYALYAQSLKSLFNVKTEKDTNDILNIAKPAISYFAEHWNDIKNLSVNDVWLNKDGIAYDYEKRTLSVSFRDSWGSNQKNWVRNAINGLGIKSYYKVCFYGLKEQRGILFSPSDIPVEEMPKPLYVDNTMTIYIGIPYVFRYDLAELLPAEGDWISKISDIVLQTVKEVDDRYEKNILNHNMNIRNIINTAIELSEKAYNKLISAY